MRYGHPESIFRTLRFQLTFWNTSVLLFLVLATLVGIREGLRYTLHREMDQLLTEDAIEVGLAVERFYPKWTQLSDFLSRKARSHAEEDWFAQILDANGAVQVASPDVPPDLPPPAATGQGLSDTAAYRLVQQPLHRPSLPRLSVRVGRGMGMADAHLQRLTQMMLVAIGFIVVVAPLGGYLLAARATRPLATIIRTTSQLHPSKLDERLTLRHTGDELDQLSATINGLLDRIAGHLEEQREFVANAAHELRSPLTALRTSAEVALERDREPDQYKDLLTDVVEQCAALGTLVNQLLLLAEGDASRLQPGQTPVRLDELVARAADMFLGVAESCGLHLDATRLMPATVRGDAAHLRQVIYNLIDNAVKFTPPGGRITLEVTVKHSERQVLLRICDTGVGISREDLAHVFERFYRGDKSRHREQPGTGTGLGLSICQVIVSAYGGQVSIDSTPGTGTCVVVSLPAVEHEPAGKR